MSDPARGVFTRVRWFEELDSTNRWLLEEAGSGAPEGTVAVAARQSAGRGRLGRRWESESGSGLLTSILFRPRLDPEELFSVPALVTLAARSAIGTTAATPVGVKWPNDLVADDRKLAGVLSETRGIGAEDLAVVVGIGINLTWPMPGPAADELGATCLQALGRAPGRPELLEALLDQVERRRPMLDTAGGRAELLAELAACTVTLGRQVRVELADETLVGTAVALDEHGRLVVATEEGRRSVGVGDVVHLR